MATVSSSDESSTAPRDFHLSSSIDSDSRLSPNKQKCPLCRHFKKMYHCRDCVQNGNFSYSTLYTQSYADTQSRYHELKAKKNDIESACSPYLEKKRYADEISSKIRQTTDSIRYLRLAIEECKTRQSHNKFRLKETRARNEKLSRSLPKYEERVQKLETYVSGKREEIETRTRELRTKRDEVKRLRKIRVGQLIDYIFPITNVPPRIEMDVSEDETTSAIIEASNTTYIKDRWILAESPTEEHQQSIVAPCLPGSGNYAAYNVSVSQNRDTVPNLNAVKAIERNAAYSISAALVYTAQLVNVISFYLDVRLPHKMSFGDFCSTEMNERQFARRLARLNANVLHLCFSQSVDLERLHPSKTLQNIMQLVDTKSNKDFGRIGPMEVDATIAQNLERSLVSDLHTSEDSESEEGDTFPNEWEAVPHVLCSEATAGVSGGPINQQQSMQAMSTQQQASSMAGGLVTSAAASIASIWRGFTGR